MMNDYLVTIPFGIAVTLSGLVSLALRVSLRFASAPLEIYSMITT